MDGTLAKWNFVSDEQLYEKDYFRNLEPHKNIIEAAKQLMNEGQEVYILSCYLADSEYALKEKNDWLDKYLPEINTNHRLFVPYGMPKTEFFETVKMTPITYNDYLIDDYTKNLEEWSKIGGTGIKYLNGINNTYGTWKGARISNLNDIYNLLHTIENIKNKTLFYQFIDNEYFDISIIPKDKFVYKVGIMNNQKDNFFIYSYQQTNNLELHHIGYIISDRDVIQDAFHLGILDNKDDKLTMLSLSKMYGGLFPDDLIHHEIEEDYEME